MYLLQELIRTWESFGLHKKLVSHLFHHHNKKISLLKNEGRNEHTNAIALREYRNNVYLPLKDHILRSIEEVWAKIRKQDEREDLIPLLISAFRLLDQILDQGNIERKDFFDRVNQRLQKNSRLFFEAKLTEWNTDDCGSYFDWLSDFSRQEEDILNQMAPINIELGHISSTLRNDFYQILIQRYKPTLAESALGFSHLISTDNYGALRNIKKLLSLYKDDMSTMYDSYKKQVANLINEQFNNYLNKIKAETDEKAAGKLKVVKNWSKQRDLNSSII